MWDTYGSGIWLNLNAECVAGTAVGYLAGPFRAGRLPRKILYPPGSRIFRVVRPAPPAAPPLLPGRGTPQGVILGARDNAKAFPGQDPQDLSH